MSAEDWTLERTNLLKTLWLQGLTCAQIAREVNKLPGNPVSRNAVIGKRVRMGLPDREGKTISFNKKPRPVKQKPVIKREPLPRVAPAPTVRAKSVAPLKDAASVRFLDREPSQCSMFCEGEDGPEGFVCGRDVVRGGFCADCAKLVYTAVQAA